MFCSFFSGAGDFQDVPTFRNLQDEGVFSTQGLTFEKWNEKWNFSPSTKGGDLSGH